VHSIWALYQHTQLISHSDILPYSIMYSENRLLK